MTGRAQREAAEERRLAKTKPAVKAGQDKAAGKGTGTEAKKP
jgi:hypothetical protein